MARLNCNGIKIGYDEAGRGRTVILVHGGLTDRTMWDPVFDDLAVDHRVIRYDWRGYGESDSGEGAFAHHRDLLVLMEALHVERATLVGNSMGGGYAVEAALAAPDRVEALVLVSPGLAGHVWPSSFVEQAQSRVSSTVPVKRLEKYRAGVGADLPELEGDIDAYTTAHLRWMIAGPRRCEQDLPASVWEHAMVMFGDQLRRKWTEPAVAELVPQVPSAERLRDVDVPTLVVNGLEDVPEIQAVADVLCDSDSGIAGARRVDLLDTGHAPPLEHPGEFAAILRQFLTEHQSV